MTADSPPQDMMQLKLELQEMLLAREEQEELLRKRERELTALKGALKEEVAAHDQEVDKMKEQYEKEISRLQTSLEEAKQVLHSLPAPSSIHPLYPPPVQRHHGLSQRGVEIRATSGGLHAALPVEPYVPHQMPCYRCFPIAASFTGRPLVSSEGCEITRAAALNHTMKL